jgi:ABC-type glycerol-3-phosphate transport system substrate-binding protein
MLIDSCRPKSNTETTILRVWQTETDTDAVKVLSKIEKEFEQKHPNVDVQIESVAWDALASRLNLAITNGTVPDLCHLEPFMAYSLYQKGFLLPLDDVVQTLEKEDRIMPAVRNLQRYADKTYGIAYAVGTTGWAYRRDLAEKAGATPPRKWADYPDFVRKLKEANGSGEGLTLPGASPFFIDQLFAELVANNGGMLFDPNTRKPLFNSRRVVEVFDFFSILGRSGLLDPSWTSTSYLDQFNRFGRAEVLAVPVTYARAGRAIQKVVDANKTGPALRPDDSVFALMEQPTGPSYDGPPLATIDCEPYVVFQDAEKRRSGKVSNADLAKEFLRLFYRKDNYLEFVRTVPIHLTPIFENMAKSDGYRKQNDYLTRWKSWAEQTDRFLADPNRTRPILMPDVSEQGRAVPHLLDVQASRIISKAVAAVIHGELDSKAAAEQTQKEVQSLLQQLDND